MEGFDLAKWAYGIAQTAVKRFHALPPDLSREDLLQVAVTEVVKCHNNAVAAGKRPNYEITLLSAWKAVKTHVLKAQKDREARASKPPQEPREPVPEAGAVLDEQTTMLKGLLDRLPEAEKTAVTLRYGLAGEEPHTAAEIAKKLGKSPQWVRQGLLDPAIAKMAAWAAGAG